MLHLHRLQHHHRVAACHLYAGADAHQLHQARHRRDDLVAGGAILALLVQQVGKREHMGGAIDEHGHRVGDAGEFRIEYMAVARQSQAVAGTAIRPPVRTLAVRLRSENGAVLRRGRARSMRCSVMFENCEIFGAATIAGSRREPSTDCRRGPFREARGRPARRRRSPLARAVRRQSGRRCRVRSGRCRLRRAAKPSWRASAPRNARLVTVPATRQRARAPARRSSAALRSGPWAMTLAIIGS